MARIRSIEPGTQAIRQHESEVDCYYKSIRADDGTTLLHLTTFGSDVRKSRPKSSQSIQIDREMAAKLIALLRDTFPGLN